MERHIAHLFADAPDGRIEIAWTDPVSRKLCHGRSFRVEDADEAVEKAAQENATEGQNVYVGAALRRPDSAPFARAKDDDFFSAPAYWVDLDDAEAVRSAKAKTSAAPPTLAVITGRKPQPRAQLWWRLEDPITDAEKLRRQNAILAETLGGDPTVINPSRVMRLAGSIAWPVKRGRVVELTELMTFNDIRPKIYVPGQVERAFPPRAQPATTDLRLAQVDPVQLLRDAKPGHWHDAMRIFTAHCVSQGYPDWLILEAARQVLDDPDDPTDLKVLINSARKKFGIADSSDSAPLNAIGLGNFLSLDLPLRETVIEPWLPVQGLAMVYAQTGIGKTYFGLNVSYAAATAGDYLGWKAEKRWRVLYPRGPMSELRVLTHSAVYESAQREAATDEAGCSRA